MSRPIPRTIAILIYSRGREDYLARLVDDMDRAFMPALEAGGLPACTLVYAQNYTTAFIAGLKKRHAAAIAAGRLIICEPQSPHKTIGEVFIAATTALHQHIDYRLAMLMDDDSLYRAAPDIDANLRAAAQLFLDQDDRCHSIRIGQKRSLEVWPFVDPAGPIMPFKEKMIWVSRQVMQEALDFPAFASLDVGEDVVLTALAWRGGANKCLCVHGIATFLHLGFEPDETAIGPITGGYGELVAYDEAANADPELGKYGKAFRGGVVPHSVLPDVFVGPEHPHHTISGIRPEAVALYGSQLPFAKLR